MARFQVAQAHYSGYNEAYDLALVHPPIDESGAEAAAIKASLTRNHSVLISNDSSDCTEISYAGDAPVQPEELVMKVVKGLSARLHEVVFIEGIVAIDMMDSASIEDVSVHSLMLAAQKQAA